MDSNLIPFARSLLPKAAYCMCVVTGLVSCTSTNNLYLNNPVPIGKHEIEGYLGVGTGLEAKIDSVAFADGAVFFSDKISISPVLSVSGQYGISDQTNLRFAFHFPKIIGGFGVRLGLQHSLLKAHRKINMALGFDTSYTFSRDSLRVLGINLEPERDKNGIINAEFFLPVSVRGRGNFTIVLTPRYSFNSFYIREFVDQRKGKSFKLTYSAVSLGVWNKNYYLEASALVYDQTVYPYFGVALRIDTIPD